MKKIFFILLSLTLIFTSCKKEESTLPANREELQSGVIEDGILLYGDWKLLSGKMYIENMETGSRTVYDHFDANKTTSSLRYGGIMFELEMIEKDVTIWTFIAPPNYTGYGEFLLNHDTIQPYGLYIVDANWSIIEHPTATAATMQLGGSSRPLTAVVDSYNDDIVIFRVQEAYESINGYNCNYYSELRFQKQ